MESGQTSKNDERSVVERCAHALTEQIVSGDVPAGSRLPAERELAGRLSVNRVTLRNALGRLAAARLVRARQGSGYTVLDFRRSGGLDLLPSVLRAARNTGTLEAVASDVLRLRRNLARAVLELIIERATEEDVAKIHDAIEDFIAVVEEGGDTGDIAAADLDVLATLLDATHSDVFRLCYNPVVAAVQGVELLRRVVYEDPDNNVLGYRMFQAWLKARPAEFVSVFARHHEQRDERMLARLRDLMA